MKTKSLFYSYWIFQLRLTLSITRFFFSVSKLSLASALRLSSGFDRTFLTEINELLSTILLPLILLSCLVFHRVQCWDLCCLFCTPLHFQTSKPITQSTISCCFCRRHPPSKINFTKRRAKPYTRPAIMYR